MAEFFFFGPEVLFGVGTGNDFAGHALDDMNSGVLQGFVDVGFEAVLFAGITVGIAMLAQNKFGTKQIK